MQTISKSGYYLVATYFNGRGSIAHCFRVHRLVAKEFVSNPDNKPEVNHIDGNKINNHYTNLEWVTPKENTNHAVEIGLIKTGVGATNAKLNKSVIQDIRKMVKNKIRTMEIVKKYSHIVKRGSIFDVIKNRAYKND